MTVMLLLCELGSICCGHKPRPLPPISGCARYICNRDGRPRNNAGTATAINQDRSGSLRQRRQRDQHRDRRNEDQAFSHSMRHVAPGFIAASSGGLSRSCHRTTRGTLSHWSLQIKIEDQEQRVCLQVPGLDGERTVFRLDHVRRAKRCRRRNPPTG